MDVWRIARRVYPVLSGEGARLRGGRWNSPGTPLVYTAGSQALAVLELLVWVDPEDVPEDLLLHQLQVPDELVGWLALEALEPDWRGVRHAGCRSIGDTWAASGDSLALGVPSAVVPTNPGRGRTGEWNYLLNPRHPAISRVRRVTSQPFSFDPRLL